jgi:murein DD-endopeptidase MepM/ murein hydrolase activator NlpD
MPPILMSRHARVRAIAVVLTAALAFGAAPGVGLGVEEELKEARQELRETKAKIRARSKRLNAIQRRLNQLATEMTLNDEQIETAEFKLTRLSGDVAVLEERTARLQDALNARNREAYIQGPGAPVLYLLTATSAAEAAARLSLLTEMNRRDEVLAAKVQENTERLSRTRAELLRVQRARELALQQLEVQRVELRKLLRQAEALFEQLQDHKDDVIATISKFRPFRVCPMGGPHALSDSFGIVHHHPKNQGGTHIHQGIDIAAAVGTPILAPFDGVAEASSNKIGGQAVKVFGQFGYVYNAHLSAFGTLGPVEAGDVIGYTGETGNAHGPHNHFEWHPENGEAVDPYPLLLKIC